MAKVTMRELLRNAKLVFEQMEHDQAPVLITRDGVPCAALVPVDPADAEAMILAAAPNLIADRDRARNAAAEGRTLPLELFDEDADDQGWSNRPTVPGGQSPGVQLSNLLRVIEQAKEIATSLAAESDSLPPPAAEAPDAMIRSAALRLGG